MTPTLYRDTGYSLIHLIEEISHGKIALPDIQRPFVWSAAKTRDLFDSLYRGYPVGTLMFWETGVTTGTKQVGGGEREGVAKLLIVDGQQRLTALYAVLTGSPVVTKSFEEMQIRIAFRPADETFEVADAAIAKDPEYLPDITEMWEKGYRPTVRKFVARLSEYRGTDLTEAEEDRLEERIDRVYDLRNFRFQVIELDSAADEEQVAEIFVRINSEGVKLNQSDFILTLMSVHWEKGRQALERFCRGAVDPLAKGQTASNPFIDPSPDQLLRASIGLAFRRGRLQHVYSILRGKDLETGNVSTERSDAQFERLRVAQEEVLDLNNWHEFLAAIAHAGFTSRRMVSSEATLIYSYVLWLIGRRDFGVDTLTLRKVIARWFFMSHTTGRYTSSSESQIESDLNRISALDPDDGTAFCQELDRIVRSNFTSDYWDISLPNRLDASAAKSPALLSYWASLNLLDAEILFSKSKVRDMLNPAITAPQAIKRHRLFPKPYLARQGLTKPKQINPIANMAFVEWPQSDSVVDEGPLRYWSPCSETVEPSRLEQQVYWHALPVGWEQLDYATFLASRRNLIAKVVRDGFGRLWEQPESNKPTTVTDLIAQGESQTVEFKSTARVNLHTRSVDKQIEHAVVKTVCGFLNAQGGVLVTGVEDDGNVLGLASDYRTLNKGDRDRYELFLRQLLDTQLSSSTATTVRFRFEHVDEHEVCLVSVAASGRPVFAKPLNGSEPVDFWVRVGNATKQLHGDDMLSYRKDHWG